jgi:hypothetical protein
MQKHIYLAVNCKTRGCGTICLIKYLGPDTGQSEVDDTAPTGFQYQCGNCHQAHRYELKDVYPFRTDSSPPLGSQKSPW